MTTGLASNAAQSRALETLHKRTSAPASSYSSSAAPSYSTPAPTPSVAPPAPLPTNSSSSDHSWLWFLAGMLASHHQTGNTTIINNPVPTASMSPAPSAPTTATPTADTDNTATAADQSDTPAKKSPGLGFLGWLAVFISLAVPILAIYFLVSLIRRFFAKRKAVQPHYTL